MGDAVYSSVHRVGNEKGVTGQRWSMKSVRLPRKMSSTDQNQTPRAVYDDGMFQNSRQTLQSRILLWEGGIQSDILTDDNAKTDQHGKAHGMTGNTEHRRS